MQTTERPDAHDSDPVARSRDVNIRAVLQFGFWLGVGTVAATLAMLGLFRILEKRDRAADRVLPPVVAANLARTPPEPRLEAFPLALGQRLRVEETELLTSYGWVDKPAGVARIPIDRAIEILAVRGLPPSKPMPPVAAPLPTPAPSAGEPR